MNLLGRMRAEGNSGARRLTAYFLLPLAVNLFLYAVIVRPARNKVVAKRQAHMLSQSKPRLESALADSSRLLAAWQRDGFSASDPSLVMQTLQQLAVTHKIRLSALNSAAQTPGSATSMPVELTASGRFGRLAHWMGDVETRSGFQIESWTVSTGNQNAHDDEQQLTIKLTAFLQSAS